MVRVVALQALVVAVLALALLQACSPGRQVAAAAAASVLMAERPLQACSRVRQVKAGLVARLAPWDLEALRAIPYRGLRRRSAEQEQGEIYSTSIP